MSDDDLYDPPKVSWQTEQLYRVEHARRQLAQSRERLRQALAQHERYEEEARQRAAAFQVAQLERAAYWASPEGKAQAARYEKERAANLAAQHQEDMARRKYRLPVWVEWAAWRHAVGKEPYWGIAVELGGIAGSVVGRAVMDYVYLNHPDVGVGWHGGCPLDSGQRRGWLRRYFQNRAEPLFPGRVVELQEELPRPNPRTPEEFKVRNAWVYRQRLGGRTPQEIGDAIGMSRSRVDQICWKQEEIDRKRQQDWPKPKPWRAPVNNGRPIDMGGPREVWLTYWPPPDPRLDNMEPVSAKGVQP